jgi:hypothetical protein
MDLKHQLVIWKKAEYLLKNLALTPKLCDLLVDYGLFTSEMIAKVQVSLRKLSFHNLNVIVSVIKS